MVISKEKYYFLLIVIIYICLSSIAVGIDGLKIDEEGAHLPTLINFYNDGIIETINSKNYEAANTPLPYLIILIPLKLFSIIPSIQFVRVFNAAISLLTIFLIFLIFKKIKVRYLFLGLLIILFYPYYLKPSFTYYMSIYGLLFFSGAILVLVNSAETYYKWFYAGVLFGLAALSQQFYLAVPPLIFIWSFTKDNKLEFQPILLRCLILFLPVLIMILPVYILWGGLTPEKYSFHKISFDAANITSILVISGGVLIPFIIHEYKRLNIKLVISSAIIALILLLIADPQWANRVYFFTI